MDHLLNQCNWSTGLWKEGMESFSQTRRAPGTIQEIILTWEEKIFKNPIVRCLWELLPGFTVCNIWKERNGCIFEGRTHSPGDIWKQTRIHIRETLGLWLWENSDLKADQNEARILSNWGINSAPSFIGYPRTHRDQMQSLEQWTLPPQMIYRLNFNGAAKGNMGPARIGGAIRNSEGNILGLFRGSIGHTTNNVAEIKALLVGLDMIQTHGWRPTILEGDSQVILQMAEKLLKGKQVHKVADNWRLIHNLDLLQTKLLNLSDVKIHHVKRKTNSLADLLANHGVEKGQEIELALWSNKRDEYLWEKCQSIQRRDLRLPDYG